MKRLLSLLMVAVLLLTAIPIVPAFAVETADVAVVFEETVTAEPMLAAEPEDDTPVTVIDSGVCGELLTWELDSNSVLTISGEGEMTDYTFGSRNPPWLSHVVDVKYVVVENGVTHIGSEAFLDLKHVTSVKLPESLRSIGSSAFKRCSKLVDIELPSGLLELGDHAFESCGALYRIEIPGGLTHLYGSTFEMCSLLTEVVFNEGLSYIGYNAFYGTNLTQITLPNSLIQIEDYAFQYCDFKEITFPAKITRLGKQSFIFCENLEEIVFLGNPPEIQSDTFSYFKGIARYPADIPTWTTEVMKDYGGRITWVDMDHVHDFVEVSVAPNCYNDGYEGLQCTRCGGRVRGIYETKRSHKLVDATCTQPRHCQWENCSYTEGGPLDHTWVDPAAVPLVCKVCGMTDTHQHDYSETFTAPTCTKQGYTTFNCKLCNDSYVGNHVAALGHTPGEPNCTTGARCTACGVVCQAPIPHTYKSEWNQGVVQGHWHDCTVCGYHPDPEAHVPNMATATAETAKFCTVCGYVIEEKFGSGKTTVIAEGLWDGGPVKWKITSDGVLTITGNKYIQAKNENEYVWKNYKDIIRRVVVADGITEIPQYCFSGMEITSVYLSNTLTSIGKYAFSNCKNLYDVNIPASLEIIELYAFYNCENLVSANFAPGGKMHTIGEYAFAKSGLTKLTTPGSLKTIRRNAFCDCEYLLEIHLGDGLEELEAKAFSGCTKLKSIFLPETLKTAGVKIFDGCYAIEEIENYGLPTYDFSERKLLKKVIWAGNAKRTEIYAFENCTALSEVIFGDNIEEINSYTFNGCISLRELILPEKLETIEIAYQNTGLTSLRIPASVKKIAGISPFRGSPITNIVFDGDAPVLGMSSFKGLTAVVAYHGNNLTWTADKLQNYGGEITWVDLDKHEHIYMEEIVESTCVEQGYTTYTCVCGETYKDRYVAATGHNYKYAVTTAPTKTADGVLSGSCANCVNIEAVPLPKLNKTDYDYVVFVEPTEETEGMGRYTWKTDDYGVIFFDTTIHKLGITPGDINDDGNVTDKDVIALLWHVLFASTNPIEGDGDINGDGVITDKDVITLLWHVLFPDQYPL